MNEPVVLQAGRLRVGFEFRGDRWQHWIELVSVGQVGNLPDSRSTPFSTPAARLESVEGQPNDPWPPSPPLQSLHVEGRDGETQVALLVGMAGKSHWSLSVEADPVRERLTFDVACRTAASAAQLQSTYCITTGEAVGDSLTAPDTTTVMLLERAFADCPTELQSSRTGWSFHSSPDSRTGPRTIRWRYTISAVP